MTVLQALLLVVAAALGGALNSVAGGGSFLTFPILLFTGVPPIVANATSTVALWPGSVASVGAYRAELRHVRHIAFLGGVSLVGGAAGALLLLHTSSSAFEGLIPYLLGLATALFAFNKRLTATLRAYRERRAGPAVGTSAAIDGRATPRGLAGLGAAQLVIATYGGYFGGGIGILMLATLGLMGMDKIHEMNALKTVLASSINGVAVVLFVLAGSVYWPQALVMLVGAVCGGYVGARYALRIDQQLLRRLVVGVGVVLTVYFFIHHA